MRYLTAGLMLTIVFALPAFADPRTECPDPGPCKVVVLNAQEEKILMDEKGILATAAQARNLDLGALATYFQQKIARAPAGDVKEVPKVEPSSGNPALGAGPQNPASK